MSTYTVTTIMTVEIANPSVVAALASGAGDERQQVQAAADLGLAELSTIARRYGFTISQATAQVIPAE